MKKPVRRTLQDIREMEIAAGIIGEFPTDNEFEYYVDAWTRYHNAADSIDGHYKGQSHLTGLAIREGKREMGDVIVKDKGKWNRAKIEALRRLGK